LLVLPFPLSHQTLEKHAHPNPPTTNQPQNRAVSDLVELVGIGVSGYYLYRYVTVGPDG
jgi:hypothetical protein